jgi:hypothetical protein
MSLVRLAAVAALSLPLLAQAPPAPAGPGFVRLNILALDDSGRPVTDLKASELQIVDQNKPQRVAYFHRKSYPLAKTGPNQFANRAAAPARTTAILLDLMNQPRVEALDSAKHLARGLQQMSSGEGVYLYALGLDGTLIPIHAMPADPLVPNPDDKTWTQQAQAGIDKAVNLVRARPRGMLQEDGVKKTYLALETIGKQLALYSGERRLIWIMRDHWTVKDPKKPTCVDDWFDCALYVPHLEVTLERTDVPVHLLVYALVSSPDTNRGIVDTAGLLGGRYFLGTDIREVLSNLNASLDGEYVAGYEVAPENADSKWHHLKVTSTRSGVKITTRQRYFAFPETRPPMAKAQDALVAAMKSVSDDPAIGIRATATPAEKALHLQITIDASDLALREQGGAFSDHVTVLLAGYGDTGQIGNPMPGDFNLKLSKEQYDSVMKDGLPFAQDFPVDSAIRKVRLLIYDHSTGSVGSLTVPVPAK